MDAARINAWIQAISAFAIVVSLVFVGLQLQQSHDIATTERLMLRTAVFSDVKNSINDHAGIWARGNSGEVVDDAERTIFENLVGSQVDFYFAAYNVALILGLDSAAQNNSVGFSTFLQENPGARRVWNVYEDKHARVKGQLYEDNSLPGFVVEV